MRPQRTCECGRGAAVSRRFVRGHNGARREDRWREEDRGYITPCWIWQMHLNEAGYGREGRNGRLVLAHRAAYEERHGPLDTSIDLDHLCRVRACVNPEHVEPVPRAINVQRGLLARLSPEDVASVRSLLADGVSHRAIGTRFGVHHSTIGRIARSESWRY